MKTSHPSIQETFGSYFHWCHILEAASTHIILPSQLQMLQCVYSFLELGEGGGACVAGGTQNKQINQKQQQGNLGGPIKRNKGGGDGLH